MRVTVKDLKSKIETINSLANKANMPTVKLDIAYGDYRLVNNQTRNEISWRMSCREMYYVLDTMVTYLDMIVR